MSVTVVSQQLEALAQRSPASQLFVVDDRSVTRGEFVTAVDRFAGALAQLDVAGGDRVALMAPTSSSMAVALFGCARAGTVAVPLSIYLKGDSLVHQLTDSGCSIAITDQAGLGLIASLEPLPQLRHVVLIDADAKHDQQPVHGYHIHDFDELVAAAPATYPAAHPSPEDTFAIIYTSGTTGLPKGCVVSHGYAGWWGEFFEEFAGASENDVFFTAAPLYHIGSLVPLIGTIRVGASMVVEASFSASGYLRRAREVSATFAIGVGWIAQAIMAQPPSELDRTHGLRGMSTVGLSVEERQIFTQRFGIPALSQQYGQTECWPVSYTSFRGNDLGNDCGQPARDLEVAFLDDAGDVVADGHTGEIVVRPRRRFRMFDGYWNDPAKTLEAYRGLWFHTGDLGCLDNGRLRYVDRKKDSIRRRGENISAYELEQVALQHDAVAEVAAFGVRVQGETEEHVQIVAIAADDTLTEQALFDHLASKMPYYAIPRFIELRAALPRNASGRVIKDELRSTAPGPHAVDFEREGTLISRAHRRSS